MDPRTDGIATLMRFRLIVRVAACLGLAATAHASTPKDLLCKLAHLQKPEAFGRTIRVTCDWPGAPHTFDCPPDGGWYYARAYLFDQLCSHPDTNVRR